MREKGNISNQSHVETHLITAYLGFVSSHFNRFALQVIQPVLVSISRIRIVSMIVWINLENTYHFGFWTV